MITLPIFLFSSTNWWAAATSFQSYTLEMIGLNAPLSNKGDDRAPNFEIRSA